jgi:pimeloyl-ACP methyl ester carboxylesterase
MRRFGPLSLVVGLALVTAACSSDDGEVSEVSAVPDSAVTSDPAPVSSAPPAIDSAGSASTIESPAVSSTTEPVDGRPGATLEWAPCDDQVEQLAVTECTTLDVPLDHDDPAGAQIAIAVARIDSADDDEQIGSLVFNPGGPGGSGIEFLVQAAAIIPTEVQRRFDLVSFDPRGVGDSTSVECEIPLDDEVALLEEGDDAGWAELVAEAETLTERCTPESVELLPWVGTNNAARDLDLLRAALGDDALTYVGYSYGTQLGAAYAELFPDRVRALVLDGAVTPSTDQVAVSSQQAAGFDRALQNFAAACDADDDCLLRELGPTLEVIDGLRAEIAEVGEFPVSEPGRVLTPGELDLAIAAALYSQDAWPYLAQGLYVAEVEQDGSILQVLTDSYLGRRSDGSYSNQTEANLAINCADQADRAPADEVRADVETAASASTYFDDFLRASTGCIGLPDAIDPWVPGPASGAPPILVIGTTGDPATPYEWAIELADFLDSGVLYTVEGEGHTAYGSIDCVAEVVNAYLIDLEVPADASSCIDDADANVFLPPGESEAERVVVYLDCLRENGLDIPEANVADLLTDRFVDEILPALDPTDPDFLTAATACLDVTPL